MNNQRVNSQDEARHNVADNQIPLCPLGFVDAPAELVIVLSLFFLLSPPYKAWMPSIKLLHPLRLIVEPACLTRWSTHPLRLSQRVVHRFITQDQSLQPSAHPHRGWGFHPRTCYLQVDWFKAVSLLLTQDHLTWIVPLLCSCLSQNTAWHMATSRAAHDSFFPPKKHL